MANGSIVVEDDAPLILTLRFDQASFDRLDGVRRRYFPAERNFIPAHLTLFHHLPAQRHASVTDEHGAGAKDRFHSDFQVSASWAGALPTSWKAIS